VISLPLPLLLLLLLVADRFHDSGANLWL